MADLEQVMREAAENGMIAEALNQAVTTALAVMLFVDFGEWRTWSDSKGWTSGPRTEAMFRAHGQALRIFAEGLAR